MKIISFRTILSSALILFGFISNAVAAEQAKPDVKPMVGKITKIEGIVEVQKFGTQDWVEAKEGTLVGSGDQVAAGIDGKARIEFSNSQTDVQPLTQFAVGRNFETKENYYTEMFLQVGKITSHVDKQSGKANRFTVTTPASVAGIRGTTLECGFVPGVGAINTITEGAGYVAPVQAENLPPSIQQILNIAPPPEAREAAAKAAEKAGAPAAVVAQIAAGVAPTTEARQVMAQIALAGGASQAAASAVQQGFSSFTAMSPSLNINAPVFGGDALPPVPGAGPAAAPIEGAAPVFGGAFGGAPMMAPAAPEAAMAMFGMMMAGGDFGGGPGMPGMPAGPGGGSMQGMEALMASMPGLFPGGPGGGEGPQGGMPGMPQGPGGEVMMPGFPGGPIPMMAPMPGFPGGPAEGPGGLPGGGPMFGPAFGPLIELGNGVGAFMGGGDIGPMIFGGVGGGYLAYTPGFGIPGILGPGIPGLPGLPGLFGPGLPGLFGPGTLEGIINTIQQNIDQSFIPTDADHDGLDDHWELLFGLNPNDANLDLDNDGFSNLLEFRGFSIPNNSTSTPSGTMQIISNGYDEFVGAHFNQASDGFRTYFDPDRANENADGTFSGWKQSSTPHSNYVANSTLGTGYINAFYFFNTEMAMWQFSSGGANPTTAPDYGTGQGQYTAIVDVDGDGHSPLAGFNGTVFHDPDDNMFTNPASQSPGAQHHDQASWANNPNPFHH